MRKVRGRIGKEEGEGNDLGEPFTTENLKEVGIRHGLGVGPAREHI